MVKKALSKAVKRNKQHRANKYQVSQAAAFYIEGQTGYREKKSIQDVALKFSKKQKLTVTEETVLVTFILESANIGFPLSHQQIKQYANAVLESKNGAGYKPVGKRWVFNFMDRHYKKLQTHWSKPLDTQCAKSLNPAAVESWFKIVEEFVVELGIWKEDIYGMDESGFLMAYTGKERVIGVITICADGTTVQPLIIFKGKKIRESWGKNNVSNSYFTCSENGWTDAKIGYCWISEVFDPEIKAKAAGQKHVLILDGHSSHYTAEFLKYARKNDIIVLGYPLHCTHALQGLDVVCFERMKEAWKKVISNIKEETKAAVSKPDFLYLFGTAYNESFTKAMVKAAFQVTWVYPFNKNAISEKQMKPSRTSSVKGEFPLPQPSPVHAILIAWGQNNTKIEGIRNQLA
ncbi:hypothetical protein CVT25_004665, partial [Psilocybe cyanescens]